MISSLSRQVHSVISFSLDCTTYCTNVPIHLRYLCSFNFMIHPFIHLIHPSIHIIYSSIHPSISSPDASSALYCYQCDSRTDTSCKEYLDSSDKLALRPTLCTSFGAEYCVKTTGVWGGWWNVFRFDGWIWNK